MIAAIVQARMGSTRLPNKVMRELAGQPMIAHVLARARAAKRIEQVILATSTEPNDDPLAEFARSQGFSVLRGSQDDVLDRYYQAAKAYNVSVIVRLTGDCPMLDPQIIDQTVGLFLSDEYDYVSNCLLHRTFPDGLDTEVFSFGALERAWREAQLKSEREHVTPYIYKNPRVFRQAGLVNPLDYSHYRWTVDELRDFALVTRIFDELYADNPLFGMEAVLNLLKAQPELLEMNQGIGTNEGYMQSLRED